MKRKRPAQRQSTRSVVKTKSRSFVPARNSRKSTPKKSSRSWGASRRRKNSQPSNKSDNSFLQTLLLWIVLVAAGGWLVWFTLIWGVIPRLIERNESTTVAVLPVTAGGDVLVAQIEPELRESKVYQLNGEETVTLPGEYGEYRISAIYPLLLIDEKDQRYLDGTLNRVFGVFIDSYALVEEPLSSNKIEIQRQLKKEFWNQLFAGNMQAWDYLRVWYILQYPNALVELEESQTLVDRIRSLNGGTFATRDDCRVAILNSTSTPGVAGGLADIVEANGGIVIRLGQYPETLENSRLVFDPSVAACEEAIAQIQTLSPVAFEMVEDSSVQGMFRAPVVAIIGKNFE